jgi:hypothetical protein
MNPYEMKSMIRKESERRSEPRKTCKEKIEFTNNLIRVL